MSENIAPTAEPGKVNAGPENKLSTPSVSPEPEPAADTVTNSDAIKTADANNDSLADRAMNAMKPGTKTSLDNDKSSAAVAKSAAISPEIAKVQEHLKDIHRLIDGRHENKDFKGQMDFKLKQTHEALEELNNKKKSIVGKYPQSAQQGPKDLLQLIMKLIEKILGIGGNPQISKEELQVVQDINKEMQKMQERMQLGKQGIDQYIDEKASMDSAKSGDKKSPGSPGSPSAPGMSR